MKYLASICAVLTLAACAPNEAYSVVKVCKAPFMRIASYQSIVKRDRDGRLFVQYKRGELVPVADGVDIKDLCP